MGVNGTWAAITVPKWQVVMFVFLGTVFGAGVTFGIRYALGVGRVDKIERAQYRLEARVDTLHVRVDSIVTGAVEPARLLRALAALRCLDGTPPNLLALAELPCERLVRQ